MNTPIMTPVKRYGFCIAIGYCVQMMHKMDDINCAFHFSTEFCDITMVRKIGGDIVLAILINRVTVAIFDNIYDGVGSKYWSKRGEGQYSYWSKLEIYDYAMGIVNQMKKEVAK